MSEDPSIAAASMFPVNNETRKPEPLSVQVVRVTSTKVETSLGSRPPVRSAVVTPNATVDTDPPPLAEGEYALRNASAAVRESGAPRVLLYVTTHMSNRHFWYLQTCWPEALRRSALLRGADVAVYATPQPEQRRQTVEALDGAFPDQALTVHVRDEEKVGSELVLKHNGAMSAMSYALERGLFEGYDWIVRVNPDVLVRDDTFLVDTMLHDRTASAMLIDCMRNINDQRIQIHTDFFMVRPSVLNANRPINNPKKNAEMLFTEHLRGDNSVLSNPKGLRWIPGADHEGPCCRAGFGKPMNETPITHVHEVQSAKGIKSDIVWLDKCPIPFVGETSSYTPTA